MAFDFKKKRWFITGGAGFIGSHVVDLLVSTGCSITVFDNLSLSTDRYIANYIKKGLIKFYKKDLLDLRSLTKAMAEHDIIFHLAGNTDIPSGFTKHRIDLDNNIVATFNVLEAMLKNNIQEIIFSSTGAVYGESIRGTFNEKSGPLVPLSLYGASKLAAESLIGAYCNLFGIKAWIFRFGNVLGGRLNHGAVYDFISKLKKNPAHLKILGTGKGEKNYFLVEECIRGIIYTYQKRQKGKFPYVVNLGTDSTTKVMKIASIVIEEMGLKKVTFSYTGTERGWPGDQPVVLLDTDKIHQLGWYAKRTSNDAVRIATRRLLGKEDFNLIVDSTW